MNVPQAEQNATGVVALATPSSSRRYLRGRRGGLEGMPTMPLDILFEIFGFLHPRDVVNLARTSKAFRTLLMSRDSAAFWRQARRKLKDLPDPPNYLSEPAYANLLFFPHCHNCLKPNIQNVVWLFAARFCKACYRSSFTLSTGEQETLMWQMTNVDGKPLQMANLVYSEKIVRRYKGKIFKPEIATMRAEWAALKDYEEREKYVLKRREFVAECKAFSERLSLWKETYDATRSSELNDLREERLRAVKERLYDEGWGYILDDPDWWPRVHEQLTDLKTVNKASKLTDKMWNNMHASVMEVMEGLQHVFIRSRLTRVCEARLAWIRMEDERLLQMYDARLSYAKNALKTYRSQNTPRMAETDREPGFTDFANIPSLRSLIMQDEANDVVLKSLRALLHNIPDLTAQWFSANEKMFARKALEALGDNFQSFEENPAALLDLAIVSFVCTKCRRTGLRWPGILAHLCLRSGPGLDHFSTTYGHAVFHHSQSVPDVPFLGREFTVFDAHVHITRSVISACGLDPNTTTFDQIEGCGVRFVSGILHTQWEQVEDWHAVRRYFMSTPECARAGATIDVIGHFALASEELVATAREQELRALSKSLSSPDKVFGCGLCPAFGEYSDIVSHLRIAHQVWHLSEVKLMERRCLYLQEDSKPQGAPTVWVSTS